MSGRYLQIQAVVTRTSWDWFSNVSPPVKVECTTQIPTFFLDVNVLGIPMKDKWEPLYREQLDHIVADIVNPCKNPDIEVHYTCMMAHCEFQPKE